MDRIKIFSPATVANVSCGFDVIGFAIDGLGDEMVFHKKESKEITITKIIGANLPFEITKNAAGFVAQKMLEDANVDFGLDIEIYKKYKPGSGLGSSAASSSGTVFAVNQLLGNIFTPLQLVSYAMLGEEVACGAQIADNVSAALYGGFVLIRSYNPLDVIPIPSPDELFVTVIHPQVELRTQDGRNVLPKHVSLKDTTTQLANFGGLISGLHTSDYDLIGRSIQDVIVEPARKVLIPHFDEVKQACLDGGALAAGISGSGPSIFALSKGLLQAEKVKEIMIEIYKTKAIAFNVYVSKVSNNGVRILE